MIWGNNLFFSEISLKHTNCSGGCLGCQPCHSFVLGSVSLFILLQRGAAGWRRFRTTFHFYFAREIELKYIQFPGVWGCRAFCLLVCLFSAKILFSFIANKSLFLEMSDFPAECKVLATSDMLPWPWLLGPCLHLETGSQFVAIRADAKEAAIKTCRNQSLRRQHCRGGLCSYSCSRFCISAGSTIVGFAFSSAQDLHICDGCIVGFA